MMMNENGNENEEAVMAMNAEGVWQPVLEDSESDPESEPEQESEEEMSDSELEVEEAEPQQPQPAPLPPAPAAAAAALGPDGQPVDPLDLTRQRGVWAELKSNMEPEAYKLVRAAVAPTAAPGARWDTPNQPPYRNQKVQACTICLMCPETPFVFMAGERASDCEGLTSNPICYDCAVNYYALGRDLVGRPCPLGQCPKNHREVFENREGGVQKPFARLNTPVNDRVEGYLIPCPRGCGTDCVLGDGTFGKDRPNSDHAGEMLEHYHNECQHRLVRKCEHGDECDLWQGSWPMSVAAYHKHATETCNCRQVKCPVEGCMHKVRADQMDAHMAEYHAAPAHGEPPVPVEYWFQRLQEEQRRNRECQMAMQQQLQQLLSQRAAAAAPPAAAAQPPPPAAA
ncbi:MAG: hypothetical protein ACKVI4_15705, partial [Actinomycetales bacterium]